MIVEEYVIEEDILIIENYTPEKGERVTVQVAVDSSAVPLKGRHAVQAHRQRQPQPQLQSRGKKPQRARATMRVAVRP